MASLEAALDHVESLQAEVLLHLWQHTGQRPQQRARQQEQRPSAVAEAPTPAAPTPPPQQQPGATVASHPLSDDGGSEGPDLGSESGSEARSPLAGSDAGSSLPGLGHDEAWGGEEALPGLESDASTAR